MNLSQDDVLRIRWETAQAALAQHAPHAISTGYVNDEWRAMSIRLVKHFLAHRYEPQPLEMQEAA